LYAKLLKFRKPQPPAPRALPSSRPKTCANAKAMFNFQPKEIKSALFGQAKYFGEVKNQ